MGAKVAHCVRNQREQQQQQKKKGLSSDQSNELRGAKGRGHPCPVLGFLNSPPAAGHPPLPRGEPPLPREEPPLPRGEPPLPRGEPSLPRGEPPLPRGEPPTPRGDPPIPRGGPPTPRAEPPTPRGERPLPRGDPPLPRGGPPTPRGEPPLPRGEQAVTKRRTAVTKRRSAITKRRTADTKRRTAVTKRRTAVTKRRTAITKRRTDVIKRRSAITKRRTADTKRRSAITKRRTTVTKRRTADTKRRTAVTKRRSAITKRRTSDTKRRTAVTKRRTGRYQEENRRYQEEIRHYQEEDCRHQEEDRRYQEENRRYQEENRHYQEENRRYQEEIHHYQEEDHRHQEEDRRHQEENRRYREDIHHYREENRRHQEENRRYQEEIHHYQEEIRHYQEEDRRHQEEDRRHQEEDRRHQEEDRRHQEENHCYQEENRRYQEENRRYQEENRRYQEENRRQRRLLKGVCNTEMKETCPKVPEEEHIEVPEPCAVEPLAKKPDGSDAREKDTERLEDNITSPLQDITFRNLNTTPEIPQPRCSKELDNLGNLKPSKTSDTKTVEDTLQKTIYKFRRRKPDERHSVVTDSPEYTCVLQTLFQDCKNLPENKKPLLFAKVITNENIRPHRIHRPRNDANKSSRGNFTYHSDAPEWPQMPMKDHALKPVTCLPEIRDRELKERQVINCDAEHNEATERLQKLSGRGHSKLLIFSGAQEEEEMKNQALGEHCRNMPHMLGAMPHGMVYDPKETPTFGLVHICCSSLQSFMACPFLSFQDEAVCLKPLNNLYCNIQGEIMVTGVSWCDLVVFAKDDMLVQRIYRDGGRI
nr:trichohyalin-like [Nerophis lumbriciformis]